MTKACFIFPLVLLFAVISTVPCQCQNDAYESATYNVQGEITSIDSVKGVIVVKWLQEDPIIGYQELVLKVPEDLKIFKGTDTIGFDDVNQFDRVTVQYCRSTSGDMPKVVSMIVENPV